jgi:DNA-binding beta-propeller fold protein YncE
LNPISTTLSPGENKPVSIAIDPAAEFLFAANNVPNDVMGFNVAADGTLTPMTRSPFAAGQAPSELAVDPSGKYVSVTNASVGTIRCLALPKTRPLRVAAVQPMDPVQPSL